MNICLLIYLAFILSPSSNLTLIFHGDIPYTSARVTLMELTTTSNSRWARDSALANHHILLPWPPDSTQDGHGPIRVTHTIFYVLLRRDLLEWNQYWDYRAERWIKNHILISSVLIWLLLKAEPEMRTWVQVVWNVLPGRSEEVGRMKRKKRKSPFKGVFSCFSTMPNITQVCILSDPALLWCWRNLLSLRASAVQKCGQDPVAESFSLLTLQWTNLRGVIMSQQTWHIGMGLWI